VPPKWKNVPANMERGAEGRGKEGRRRKGRKGRGEGREGGKRDKFSLN